VLLAGNDFGGVVGLSSPTRGGAGGTPAELWTRVDEAEGYVVNGSPLFRRNDRLRPRRRNCRLLRAGSMSKRQWRYSALG
jgi:hypothetical protein